MHIFDWCQTKYHSTCPQKYQKWYHGKQRVGRKMVEAIIYLDEWVECDCNCHNPSETKDIPKKPTRKATRRKK